MHTALGGALRAQQQLPLNSLHRSWKSYPGPEGGGPLHERGHKREGTAQTSGLCSPVQKVKEKGRSSRTDPSEAWAVLSLSLPPPGLRTPHSVFHERPVHHVWLGTCKRGVEGVMEGRLPRGTP